MAWGVEARVPFLDLEFLDVAMRMDAAHKMVRPGRIEKAVLREAFAGALPDAILWRAKEQFSDGVGYGWIDGLKAHAARVVSDAEFAQAAERFPINPPQTKEAYLYRAIFERFYPGDACARTVPGGKSIACSSPAAIAWDAAFAQQAELVLLQRLADLVVADLQVSDLGRGRRVLDAGDLLVAPVLQRLGRGGVMPVYIDDEGLGLAHGSFLGFFLCALWARGRV